VSARVMECIEGSSHSGDDATLPDEVAQLRHYVSLTSIWSAGDSGNCPQDLELRGIVATMAHC